MTESDWTIHPGIHWAEAIADSGRTQRDVAADMGISEKHMSQICRGRALPSADLTVAFARVTGVPLQMFWNLACNYRLALALEKKDLTADYLDPSL